MYYNQGAITVSTSAKQMDVLNEQIAYLTKKLF